MHAGQNGVSPMPLHPRCDQTDVVVFNLQGGLACSICAPRTMAQHEVELAAMRLAPAQRPWQAVDKSKPPISLGVPTPNPCERYPDRQHWFLVSIYQK